MAAYLTEDAVPQGFNLPPGLTGPMPPSVADHVAAVALFGKPSSGFMQMIYSGAPPITVGPRYTAKTTEQCISRRSGLLAPVAGTTARTASTLPTVSPIKPPTSP